MVPLKFHTNILPIQWIMCILCEIFRALMFDIWLQVTESRVKDDEYIKMQKYVLQTSKHSLNLKFA